MSSGMDSTWIIMDDTTDLFWGQAGYNTAIAVDPLDHNTICVGAIALWKSSAGGVGGSWPSRSRRRVYFGQDQGAVRNYWTNIPFSRL